MRQALPVAVQFLLKGNKEICRNLTSYLSLAAIDNALSLAQDASMDAIIESIEKGRWKEGHEKSWGKSGNT